MAETILEAIAEETKERGVEAEQVLLAIAAESRTPNYNEMVFLQRVLQIDQKAIEFRELPRANRILRAKAVAGSQADREALAKHSDDARKTLATKGPKITEQIAKLQAELAELELTANVSEKRLEQANIAVEQLQKLAPSFATAEYNMRKSLVKNTIGRELADAEIVASHRRHLLGEIPTERTAFRLFAESLQREDRGLAFIDEHHHLQIVGDMLALKRPIWESELAQAEMDIARLQPLLESELAKCQELLNYHVS